MQYQIHTKHPACPKHINLIGTEKKRDDRTDIVTMCKFINDFEKYRGSNAPFQLVQLMNSIQVACKMIALTLRKSSISQMQSLGISKQLNILEFKKMEKYFNDLFINLIYNTYTTCLIASKDSEELFRIDTDKGGKYLVIFAASDALLNVDASLCMGSTFLIMKKKGTSRAEEKDILQSGQKIIAAGYTSYGFSTEMVIAFEGGTVNGFTLDQSIGEFVLTDESIRIPKTGKSYCANEGFTHSWDQNLVDYLNKKKAEKAGSLSWSARYTGSFIADAHRTIKFGGIFINPPTKEFPKGIV